MESFGGSGTRRAYFLSLWLEERAKAKARELTADDVLPEYDSNLGPSMPLSKEPTGYGKEEDAVVISKCGDKKKLLQHWQYQRKRVGKLSCTADTMMALSVNGR